MGSRLRSDLARPINSANNEAPELSCRSGSAQTIDVGPIRQQHIGNGSVVFNEAVGLDRAFSEREGYTTCLLPLPIVHVHQKVRWAPLAALAE